MGTSKSYGGPADRMPLLPAWALQPQNANSTTQEPSDKPQSDAPTTQTISTDWQQAKGTLSRTITGSPGGASSGGGNRFSRSAQKYVQALGGSKSAAAKASAGIRSTARFAGFLSGIAANGLKATLTNYGLGSYIGRDADTVFAAITNVIAPSGDTREAIIARKAITEALEELYNKVVADDGKLDRLDSFSKEDLSIAIESAIANYVFSRWVEELGLKLEEKSITEQQAIRLERDMKEFVRESVKLELKDLDILNIDWSATAGRQITEKLFQEAYAILETIE